MKKNSWLEELKNSITSGKFEAIVLGIVIVLCAILGYNDHIKDLDRMTKTKTISITGEVTDLQHYIVGGFPEERLPGTGHSYYAYMLSDGMTYRVKLNEESYNTLKAGDTITADYSYYLDNSGEEICIWCVLQD